MQGPLPAREEKKAADENKSPAPELSSDDKGVARKEPEPPPAGEKNRPWCEGEAAAPAARTNLPVRAGGNELIAELGLGPGGKNMKPAEHAKPVLPSAIRTAPGNAGKEDGRPEQKGKERIPPPAKFHAGEEGEGDPVLLAIMRKIEAAKRYPRIARKMGIEGTAVVRFRLRPKGEVEAVELAESSGSEVLDKAAQETVREAAPLPFKEGWLKVGIVFKIL